MKGNRNSDVGKFSIKNKMINNQNIGVFVKSPF